MPIEKLFVGEVSTTKKAQIRKWASEASISLTMDGSSQLSFTVTDPGLRMHNAGYFVVRRPVSYEGLDYEFEITSVEVSLDPSEPPQVIVEARSRGIQKLKRQKGAMVWNNMSPTRLAAMLAGEMGLSFYGETSATLPSISRTQTEGTDESSWDVLARLAGELQFVVFEAGGMLYFASEKNILAGQPNITLTWPSVESDPFYVHSLTVRRSDDDVWGADLEAAIDRTNATQLRPGMTISLVGVSYFSSRRFLITSVEWEEGVPDPVSVQARMIEASADVGCETQTFQLGSTGDCVNRIQEVVGVPETGVFDEITHEAVIEFQGEHGLPQTGIVEQGTWAAIAAAPDTTETSGAAPATLADGSSPYALPAVGAFASCRYGTIGPGSTGPCVRLCQRIVGAPDDGIYGPVTAEAIRRWKSSRPNLLQDSVFHPGDWEAYGGGVNDPPVPNVNPDEPYPT